MRNDSIMFTHERDGNEQYTQCEIRRVHTQRGLREGRITIVVYERNRETGNDSCMINETIIDTTTNEQNIRIAINVFNAMTQGDFPLSPDVNAFTTRGDEWGTIVEICTHIARLQGTF